MLFKLHGQLRSLDVLGEHFLEPTSPQVRQVGRTKATWFSGYRGAASSRGSRMLIVMAEGYERACPDAWKGTMAQEVV